MASASAPRNRLVYTVSRFAMLCVSRLWFRLRTEGSEHLPSEGPVLLVGNHASYLDPPLMGMGVGRQVNFLAQAGLASFAPLRWWLRQVGVTLIDRDAPSKDAMRWVGSRLKAGEVVGIFPEGTRSSDGCVMPFKGGVEFLVRRSKATGLGSRGRARSSCALVSRGAPSKCSPPAALRRCVVASQSSPERLSAWGASSRLRPLIQLHLLSIPRARRPCRRARRTNPLTEGREPLSRQPATGWSGRRNVIAARRVVARLFIPD
jgi:1-acyl-sn-glycerol-3-phosphate acyltransferase